MPELPDVEIYKKQAEEIINTEIEEVSIKDKKFVDFSSSTSNKALKGKKITDNKRVGKYLFLEIEKDKVLVMHFGMTGSLKCTSNDKDIPDYSKLILHFKNNKKLNYISKRKLGKVEIQDNIDGYLSKNDIGPDIGKVKNEEFISKIKNKKSMIKSALMDQSLMSGIGNVYSDEILFQAGIHPGTSTKDIMDDQLDIIYEKLHEVINVAIEKQAQPDNFPGHFLLHHRKEGVDCPKCKGKLEKIKIAGRSALICPSCQKK